MMTCFSQKNKRAENGFTFVEVMFSMLIMTMLVVVTITALTFPRKMAVLNARKQAAIQAASDELEKAVSMGFSDPRLAEGVVTVDFGARYTLNGQTLSGERSVEILAGGTLKRISVSVDYPGGDRPVILQTLITP